MTGMPIGFKPFLIPSGLDNCKADFSQAGLPNTFWWADRKTGVCGVYTSHVIPPGDPKSIGMFAEFEKAVYQKVNEMKKK